MKVTFKLFRCHSVEIRRLSLFDTIPLFSSVSEFMSNSNFFSKKTAPYICTKLKTQIVKKTRTGPRPWWSFDFRALIGSSTCSVRLISAGKQSRPIAVHASREHQWLLRFSRTIRRFIDPVELIYYRYRNSKFRNRTACEMLLACSYWKKSFFSYALLSMLRIRQQRRRSACGCSVTSPQVLHLFCSVCYDFWCRGRFLAQGKSVIVLGSCGDLHFLWVASSTRIMDEDDLADIMFEWLVQNLFKFSPNRLHGLLALHVFGNDSNQTFHGLVQTSTICLKHHVSWTDRWAVLVIWIAVAAKWDVSQLSQI